VDSSPSTSFGRKSNAIRDAHTRLDKESKLKTEIDTITRKGKEREAEPSSSKEMESPHDFEDVREISNPRSKSSPKRKSQLEESPTPKRSKKSNMNKVSQKETTAAREMESGLLEKQKGKNVGTFKSSVSLISSSLVSSNLGAHETGQRVIETSGEDESSPDAETKAGRKPSIEAVEHSQANLKDGAHLPKAKRPQSSPKLEKSMSKREKHANAVSKPHKGKHPSVDVRGSASILCVY
jgi:hypothetical protein